MTNPHPHDIAEVLPLVTLISQLNPIVVQSLQNWPGVAVANGILENA